MITPSLTPPESGIDYRPIIKAYLHHHVAIQSPRKTFETYAWALRRYHKFMKRHPANRQMTTLFYQWLIKKYGREAQTANAVARVVRCMWRWAEAAGLIGPGENPTANVQLPHCPPPRKQTWITFDEYIQLKDSDLLDDWMRYFVVAAYNTGLRLGGVCMLRWANVNMPTRTINTVDQKVRHTSGAESVVRWAPESDLEPLFADWIRRPAPQGWEEYVCPEAAALYSRPSGGNVSQTLSQAFRAAGVPKTAHSFRRAVCTNLINSGCDYVITAQIVGMQNPATLKRYAQPDMEKIGERLRQALIYAKAIKT